MSNGLICVSPPPFPWQPPGFPWSEGLSWNPPAELMTSSTQLYRNKGQVHPKIPPGRLTFQLTWPRVPADPLYWSRKASSALILPLTSVKLEHFYLTSVKLEKYALKCEIKEKTMKKYGLDQCERSIWSIKLGKWENRVEGRVWHQDRRTQLLSGSATFRIETFLEVEFIPLISCQVLLHKVNHFIYSIESSCANHVIACEHCADVSCLVWETSLKVWDTVLYEVYT